jgi:SNF2 family DNA or RNA helicase
MPTSLKLHDGNLGVKLSGYDSKAQFNDALARVKAVPGRRWDPDSKLWLFPKDPETALRLMASLEPVASAEVTALVHDYSAKTAEQLVTQIGDDGIVACGVLSEILFPYQRAFVQWNMTHPHVVLADEMGVGKTTEAIAAWFEARYRVGIDTTPLTAETARLPMLAVCPNPTRKNYARTIEVGPVDRHGKPLYDEWPGVEAQVIDGRSIGARRAQLKDSSAQAFVVNWEKLRSDAELLRSVSWGCVIASEAHRAKNRKAQQTRGLFKLDAPMLIAETGTPVMNTPAELWTLLRWGWPETYSERHAGGGYWAFHYSYVDDYPTKYGRQIMGLKNVDGLRFELADKLVRRTKKQVLPDLPEKLEPVVIEVELNAEERKLYQEVETALFVDVAQHVKSQALAEVGVPERQPDADALIAAEERIAAELADLPL